MITGSSRFVYRFSYSNSESSNEILPQLFVSKNLRDKLLNGDDEVHLKVIQIVWQILGIKPKEIGESVGVTVSTRRSSDPNFPSLETGLHVDVNIVNDLDLLDTEAFKKWNPDFANAEFILEDADGNPTIDPTKGKYICGSATEKISKSYFNVVNPDEIIDKYGADTLRMYEMFLGPLEQSKPWSTSGIDGVYKFLRRFWNLFHDNQGTWNVTDAESRPRKNWKALHKVIKKSRIRYRTFFIQYFGK